MKIVSKRGSISGAQRHHAPHVSMRFDILLEEEVRKPRKA